MCPFRRVLPLLIAVALIVTVGGAVGCTRGRFIGEKWGNPSDRARTTWFVLRPAREFPSLRESVLAAYDLDGVDRVMVDDEESVEGGLKTEAHLSHLVRVEHRRSGDGTCDVQCALQRGGYCVEEVRTTAPRTPTAPLSRPPIREFEGPRKVSGPPVRARAW